MLQQTQAARVVPAYRAFVRSFPSVRSLARATRRDVVEAWGGLGYNRRAVALSEAAREIVRAHNGRIPSDPALLRRLPGIGPYTAAAVASIAFGVPVPAIDTNVRRIIARVFVGSDVERPSVPLAEIAARALDASDPGRWNQALMDLGREICRPRPRCERCPLAARCRFAISGAEPYPPGRRQSRFEGSTRQARGAIVRSLGRRRERTISTLVRETGFPVDRVVAAVRSLDSDGLVEAGAAALAGRPSGRARLRA